MKSRNTTVGIVSLLVLSTVLGFMGVVARNLTEFTLLQQVYARTLLAVVIIAPFYLQQLSPKTLLAVPRTDLLLAAGRGAIYYISVVLVSYAAIHTELFVAAALNSLPFAALFGIFLLNEKLTPMRVFSLAAAAIGVVTMQGLWQADLTFGTGELAAIASSVLFGLTYVARKWQTDKISNSQQTTVMLLAGGLSVLLLSLIAFEPHSQLFSVSNTTVIWLIVGGILNAGLLLLTNIGFANVPALVGDILLKMIFVFSFIFGYVIYDERIQAFEILGAAIIVLGTVMLSYSENKRSSRLQQTPN